MRRWEDYWESKGEKVLGEKISAKSKGRRGGEKGWRLKKKNDARGT